MRLAISIGDLNGIGLEIALRSHEKIKKLCTPLYCIDKEMLKRGAELLHMEIPDDFQTLDNIAPSFEIKPGECSAKAGAYSFASFTKALELVQEDSAKAVVTLPINKDAWVQGGISYKGHTDALSALLGKEAIMMLGCPKMYTILFTHHIPIKEVPKAINHQELVSFLLRVQKALHVKKFAVLGLNPHAGDNGVLGEEDFIIEEAIQEANKILDKEIFFGPLVPDIAFSEKMRQEYNYFICMYHDQGLIPLKTLFFEESINVSLDSGVIRTSVDHGTAFDIAYKGAKPSCLSYLNAVNEALNLALR